MEQGKVKFYNKGKKFGFIEGNNGIDYFFMQLEYLQMFI